MKHKTTHHRRLAVALLGVSMWLPIADMSGQETPADLHLTLARESAEVTTTGGRTFSGLLDGMRDGRLWIKSARDGGEIGYSFAPEEIGALVLPGAEMEARAVELCDRGLFADALPLLEALGRQRSRYLPVLDAQQRRPLTLLIRASDAAGDPHTTIGFARLLEPFVESTEERTTLRDAVLNAYVQLDLNEETRRLAEAWCRDADPHGTSALGWMVLARLALDAHDAERARWIALQPIAFSSHRPTTHLDTCYAIAITAAHELGDPAHARLMVSEMQQRRIAWPADKRFAAIEKFYADTDTDHQTSGVVGPKPESSASRPRSFMEIRKLVAQPRS